MEVVIVEVEVEGEMQVVMEVVVEVKEMEEEVMKVVDVAMWWWPSWTERTSLRWTLMERAQQTPPYPDKKQLKSLLPVESTDRKLLPILIARVNKSQLFSYASLNS